MGGIPPKFTTLDALDRQSGASVDRVSADKLLGLFVKHSEPSRESVNDRRWRLIVGALVVAASLGIGFYTIHKDKTGAGEGVKQGVSVVIACISAAGGFLAGAGGKP